MLFPACPASRWIPGCVWKGCRQSFSRGLTSAGKGQGTFRRGVHCLLSAVGAPVRRQAQGTVHQRLCVVLNDRQRKEAAGPQVSTDWFWIVETPHPTRLKGFPMDSIAVNPQTGRYWVEGDLKDEQNAKGSTLATGVRRFFSELLQNDLRSEIAPYPDRSEKHEK